MTDLIKRLRVCAAFDPDQAEAADRIEQQAAQIEALRAEKEKQNLDITGLKIRNTQLEAALREKDNIAYVIDSHGISHDTFTIVYRAALLQE